MKRMLLCIAVVMMIMTTAQASEIGLEENNDFPPRSNRYRNVQPVLFTYNHVDYAIFPNGKVEFELPQRAAVRNNRQVTRRYDVYRRSNRNYRSSFVRYNRYGQVTKIGNTRISYNSRGNVARIGTLNVSYRYGALSNVGGLQVLYNRRGQITAARGHVLVRNFYGHGHDCSDHDFGHFNNGHDDDHQDWDDGVYFERKAK
jgi:hypothetical protein